MIDNAIHELSPIVGTTTALAAVGVDRAGWYRRHRLSAPPPPPERVATVQPRALSDVERKQIKATLESDEFVDEAPATVYAKLLDQGRYLGSVSTMYRVLGATTRSASAGARPPTPPTRSPSSSPPGRTRSGRGTSPSSTARRSGPTTTCM
jgi:putative transposase